MFRTSDLARVAVSEFRRGLEGLTAEEAATRLPKADGTTMNAIAWSVEHIAQHWSNARWAATGAPGSVPPAPSDGTPPSWQDALAYLDSATSDLSWIDETSDCRLVCGGERPPPRGAFRGSGITIYGIYRILIL